MSEEDKKQNAKAAAQDRVKEIKRKKAAKKQAEAEKNRQDQDKKTAAESNVKESAKKKAAKSDNNDDAKDNNKKLTAEERVKEIKRKKAEKKRASEGGQEKTAQERVREIKEKKKQKKTNSTAEGEERAKKIADAKAKADEKKAKAENEENTETQDKSTAAKAKAKARAAKKKKQTEEQKPSPHQWQVDKYVSIIRQHLGDDRLESAYINQLSKHVPTIVAKQDIYFKIAECLRYNEQMAFDYLSETHGIDYETHMEVYTHLFSFEHKQSVALKVKLNRDQPEIDSLTPLWEGANWPEREAYDLLGIKFRGHPNLTRIMMSDDWEGHPLRKDYQPYDVEV